MAAAREGREWIVRLDDFEDEEGYVNEDAFRQKVEIELARLENMMFRLGRGFMVAPIRVKREHDGNSWYETVGVVFRETFVPAAREQAPTPDLLSEDAPLSPDPPAAEPELLEPVEA